VENTVQAASEKSENQVVPGRHHVTM